MPHASDWFEDYDASGPGLRFSCTMCGNCCTGPEGYILYTEAEAAFILGGINHVINANGAPVITTQKSQVE